MTTIRLKLTALIVFYTAFLFAQDLTGIWQGVSSKNEIPRVYYVLTLTLQQTGANVTGNGLTKLVNDLSYAIQSVKGTINGNILTFADQAIQAAPFDKEAHLIKAMGMVAKIQTGSSISLNEKNIAP